MLREGWTEGPPRPIPNQTAKMFVAHGRRGFVHPVGVDALMVRGGGREGMHGAKVIARAVRVIV